MATYTAKQMGVAIGATVLVECSGLSVACIVTDAKSAWGKVRYQVMPVAGQGQVWVEDSRVIREVIHEGKEVRVDPGTGATEIVHTMPDIRMVLTISEPDVRNRTGNKLEWRAMPVNHGACKCINKLPLDEVVVNGTVVKCWICGGAR